MRIRLVALLSGTLLIVSACQADEECNASLQDCVNCPKTEEAARLMSQNYCNADGQASAGSCGENRYLRLSWLSGGPIMYYDSNGDLLALRRSTDVSTYCGKSFSIEYGQVPECTVVPEIDRCALAETL